MTTIAWDGETLASDTLSTSGNMKLSGICKKTLRVGKYRVAFSGEYAPAQIFFKNNILSDLELGEMKYEPFSPSEDDYTILIIEDGCKNCWLYNSTSGFWDEFQPPIAIGSGSKYAIGSMYSGFSSESAVEVSCKLDTHSGLPVHIEE